MKPPSLKKLLKKPFSGKCWPVMEEGPRADALIKELQLRMLRVQQGAYHQDSRLVIAIEGFDAAGKGGLIRRITHHLDPRGCIVHPIGPPGADEQGRHYLHRFWRMLPAPGEIAIFDRTWYGRVLVEKVDGLAPRHRIRQAYDELVSFEKMLRDDGVRLVKIFLAIDREEQLRRFEERLKDPYKQWKLSETDVRMFAQWDQYVEAADTMFRKTHTRTLPWHLVPANDKTYARVEGLKVILDAFSEQERWMNRQVRAHQPAAKAARLRRLLRKS
jgi:polyphosphate kinase 2 (PPK2 family)